MGVCNLCYAFRNSPWPQCCILELAFSEAEIRRFLKANGRLIATWNTSLLDLLFTVTLFLVWLIYTAPRVCTSVLSLFYDYL